MIVRTDKLAKKCKYCGNFTVFSDDYVFKNNLIHQEKCINMYCKALNYAKITPAKRTK